MNFRLQDLGDLVPFFRMSLNGEYPAAGSVLMIGMSLAFVLFCLSYCSLKIYRWARSVELVSIRNKSILVMAVIR